MTREELQELILSKVSDAQVLPNKQFLDVLVPVDKFKELATFLKDSENTAFDYLFNLTGVDWGQELMVVYHLKSTKHNHYVVLKQKTADRENPVVDTVADLWITAEWHEREAFDLLGIVFKKHPDMRRLFLDEDWEGYPLRKDYTDEINIIER